MRVLPVVALLLAVTLGGAACSGSAATPSGTASAAPGAGTIELTVFGAGSLKGALEGAKIAYEAATPGVTLVISIDSSTTLATQIEQGAPADVFLSADTKNPQRLADGGFAAGAPVPFANNELTVIVPASNPAGLASPADLARAGVKVIAAGDDVPITRYATQLVANLARIPGYPAGFEAAYGANVASKEDNVNAVVTKLELGEGDAGIVYVTDATASGEVVMLALPDGANVPATYAGIVVKASAHLDAAAAFLDWFAGPEGQGILVGFGFLPAP
ncbi:MAG TPA: molybdate ABC transporter substrate-binding protein [Candidatus Limnocylindrales bacterium]|nr:molybdate ABC transporter substrate-binding protein [Candidatus Limnocylindrales bacterium]